MLLCEKKTLRTNHLLDKGQIQNNIDCRVEGESGLEANMLYFIVVD
jgi:hypothetical protein